MCGEPGEVSSVETPNSHTHSYHLIVSKQTKHRARPTPTTTDLTSSNTTLFKTWTPSKTWGVIKSHKQSWILCKSFLFKTKLKDQHFFVYYFLQVVGGVFIETLTLARCLSSNNSNYIFCVKRAKEFFSQHSESCSVFLVLRCIFLHLGICIET